MKNIMKKFLTLTLAALMIATAVISVSAGNILTDKDLTGGIIDGYYPGYTGGCLNYWAKCPECGRSCYQYTSIVEGCVLYTYLCYEHGLVTPVEPKPDDIIKPFPPAEDDDEDNKIADFEIKTYATWGGQITLDSKKPIKKWDSRTVYITPDFGYICVGVYVNGFYVGVEEKLELKYITKDYTIMAYFQKVDTKRDNAVVITTKGNGEVTGKLNSKSIGEVTTTAIKYKDVLVLNFNAAKNYIVKNVKINGLDLGAIDNYTLSKLYYDVKIEVTYEWKNPWVDVKEHLDAVEYVTENGIMGSPNKFMNTDEFQGDKKVNNYLLCAFLAEMADSADVLNEHKDRTAWMKKMEVVPADMNMSMRPNYKEAAEIVLSYLRMIEKENDITFTALQDVEDAKGTAKVLGFYNEKTFETGRVSRYDVAEICYAIAQLESK